MSATSPGTGTQQCQWPGLLLAAGGATAFSGKAIIVKLAYRYGVDAVTVIMLRMLFALPIFLAMAWWASRGKPPLARREWIGVLGLGFSGYYLASFLDEPLRVRLEDHLRRALELGPDHLSLYALAVEEATPLARHVASGRWTLPDDDLVADMYEAALPIVASADLVHDEVSNWARPGHASRHNRAYWRNEAYIGVGPARSEEHTSELQSH